MVWRVIDMIHVRTEPLRGSYAPARRHKARNTACAISSAAPRSLSIRTPDP
jgi:hypothetical protein